MSITLVDSSIWLDLVTKDRTWRDWSRRALEDARSGGGVAINQIIYAEVAPAFQDRGLDPALSEREVLRLSLPWPAALLAGRAHKAYRRKGGARQTILPDFLIGAHAALEDMTLLTRDPKRNATLFPGLRIITPDHP